VSTDRGSAALLVAIASIGAWIFAPGALAAPGDAIVIDQEGSLNDQGSVTGLDLRSGRQRLISSNLLSAQAGRPSLLNPTAIAVADDGSVLVADTYGLRGKPAIFRVDPRTGRQALFASNRMSAQRGGTRALGFPTALAVTPGGDLLVADFAGGGRLIRVDARTRRQRIVTTNSRSRARGGAAALSSPVGVVVAKRGIAVATTPRFFRGRPQVLLVDGRTGRQRVLTTNRTSRARGGGAHLSEPISIGLAPEGDLLVGDQGAIVRIDGRGRQRLVAQDTREDGSRDFSADVTGVAARSDGTVIATKTDLVPGPPSGFLEKFAEVVAVAPASEQQMTLSTNQLSASQGGDELLLSPTAVGLEGCGSVLVADKASSGDFGPGLIARVDPSTGRQQPLTSSAVIGVEPGEQSLSFPTAAVMEPGGTLLVADRYGDGLSGSILRVDVRSGRQTVVSSNARAVAAGEPPLLQQPRGLALAADGSLFVAVNRRSVNGRRVNGRRAFGVIRVDTRSGAQTRVSSNALSRDAGGEALLRTPVAIALDRAGRLLIADSEAFGGSGGLIRVDPATGRQTAVSSNRLSRRAGAGRPFVEPNGLAISARGRVLVTDRLSRSGALIEVEPRTGAARLLSTNLRSRRLGGRMAFRSPRGVAFAPGGGVLVSDLGAPFRFTGKAAGLVVRVNGRTGRQERVYTNRVSRRRGGGAEFARPGGILIEPPRRPE
jgi:sugar lactone lactonase YvrE